MTQAEAVGRSPTWQATERETVWGSGVHRRKAAVKIGPDAGESILGRLHSARLIDVDLAGLSRLVTVSRKHMTAQPWTVDGDLFVSFRGGMRPLLHHGSLHVRGSLLIDDHAWLVCTGDLIVDGIVSDYRPGTLAVGGNLMTRRLITTGSLTVLGDARVSDVGFARNRGEPIAIGGELVAPTMFHVDANVRAARVTVDRAIDLADAHQLRAHRFQLSPEVFSEAGAIDEERCDRLLRCDLPLFV